MAEAIDIRELNERIERESAFVTNLVTGMDQVIVGSETLGRIFADRIVVGRTYIAGRSSGTCKDSCNQNIGFIN